MKAQKKRKNENYEYVYQGLGKAWKLPNFRSC